MGLSRDADYATYLYTCNRCRSCTTDRDKDTVVICPSYDRKGFFSYSGGGKGYVAQGILEGKVPADEETAELAMHCLLCHGCATMCPPGFELMNVVRDIRGWLVSQGVYSSAAHRRILDNMRKSGNPWGLSLSKRVTAKELGLTSAPGDAEAVLFLGCHYGFGKNPLSSEAKIIKASGAKVVAMDDEPCCFGPALDLGDRSLFEKAAEKNIENLNSLGVEKVISLCPHCASAMTNEYFEIGDLEPEVVHFSEWVFELIDEGRLDVSKDVPAVKATYQDPCHLVRYLDKGEAPREIFAKLKGLDLVEMKRHGEATLCCGGGSWAMDVSPGLWRFTSRERMKEARDTGADAIITACPHCDRSFDKARSKADVIPLSRLVADRIAD